MAPRRVPDSLIDLALEETFPASDPPFFMAGTAIGPPYRPKRAERAAPARDETSPSAERDKGKPR
jgi:hypothetical protein